MCAYDDDPDKSIIRVDDVADLKESKECKGIYLWDLALKSLYLDRRKLALRKC